MTFLLKNRWLHLWILAPALFALSACGSTAVEGAEGPTASEAVAESETQEPVDPGEAVEDTQTVPPDGDSAVIRIFGADTFEGEAELLCVYWEDTGEMLATFSSLEINDLDVPAALVYIGGEYDNEAGGGIVINATYAPVKAPSFSGQPDGMAQFSRVDDAGLVNVRGTASVVASDLEFNGTCRPTPGE